MKLLENKKENVDIFLCIVSSKMYNNNPHKMFNSDLKLSKKRNFCCNY